MCSQIGGPIGPPTSRSKLAKAFFLFESLSLKIFALDSYICTAMFDPYIHIHILLFKPLVFNTSKAVVMSLQCSVIMTYVMFVCRLCVGMCVCVSVYGV